MSRPTGFKHTNKTKLKMSLAQKGRKLRYSNHKGYKHSEETRKKMRLSSQKRWNKLEEHDKVSGNNSKFWNGGIYKNGNGYILKQRNYEHRLIMEKHIGRKLLPKEVVHHLDRNRSNNKIENLMLFSNQAEHIKYHAENY